MSFTSRSGAKRIALVIGTLGPGGAERALCNMANYWSRRGRDVTVVALSDRSQAPFYELDLGVRYVPLGVIRRSPTPVHAVWNNMRRILRLRRALKSLAPDVVISFIDRTNVITLLAARGLRVPVVVDEQSDPLLHQIEPTWERLRRWTYRSASAIVVVSERASRYFASRVGGRVLVIPNPIQVPLDGVARSGEESQRQIVAMGRLGREKGFDLLLSAFARANASHPDWRLIILGEGPLRRDLEALRDRLGLGERVEMPGTVAQPHRVLRECDLFVLSSRFEGFPLALCEAMACGLPVIATEYHEGVREIVQDGVNGVLVPSENPDALASAMERLISDENERRRLGLEAMRILERFGTETVMEMWETVLGSAGPANR